MCSRKPVTPCFAPCLSGPTFRPRRMIVPDIVPTRPEVIPPIIPTQPEVIPPIVPTQPEVIPDIVPTRPEVIPQIVPRRRSEHRTMVGCRYVRTLHTTLHVTRNRRSVRPHGRRSQSP